MPIAPAIAARKPLMSFIALDTDWRMVAILTWRIVTSGAEIHHLNPYSGVGPSPFGSILVSSSRWTLARVSLPVEHEEWTIYTAVC